MEVFVKLSLQHRTGKDGATVEAFVIVKKRGLMLHHTMRRVGSAIMATMNRNAIKGNQLYRCNYGNIGIIVLPSLPSSPLFVNKVDI